MRRASLLLLTLVSWALSTSAFARAPDTFEEEYAEPVIIASPQWFTFELKIGPYRPNYDAFRVFKGDRGWLLSTEVDVTAWHIPYVGQLNVGAGWGWANYDAKAAIVPGGEPSGESTELTIYPMSALAVLRIDALARHTVVPLLFAGKIGYDFVRWKQETSGIGKESGVNMGFRWGAQLGLELDFIDTRSARRLDDDWGINHTFLLFEYFESKTEATADRSYQFGLGLQF